MLKRQLQKLMDMSYVSGQVFAVSLDLVNITVTPSSATDIKK
jgi:hypothetical protein